MNFLRLFAVGSWAVVAPLLLARAEPKVTVDHNPNDQATAAFAFKNVPYPSAADLALNATFKLVAGDRDRNGGGLEQLHDGRLPTEEDQPAANFFLQAGTEGGRLLVDLGQTLALQQVNTYSWHPGARGPQVYTLFASDGQPPGFNQEPGAGLAPETCGWKLVAKVDTRPADGDAGGQYAVSISDPQGPLGRFRFLLFEIARTEDRDAFGNTFYSEIDVLDAAGVAAAKTARPVVQADLAPFLIKSPDGYCEIAIHTAGAPELKDWAEQKLAPMLAEWYPKLTALLASEGYEAPRAFRVTLKPGDGVAATAGTNITANSNWLKRELEREALGALLHEEVHVVQQYRFGRRSNPGASRVRPPGWLVEGIPDYIRWFKYEPESHGADLVWLRSRRNRDLRYDAGYRVSANFLNYVAEKYTPDLVTKLNAACRQGTYSVELWKTCTGKTLAELAEEWTAATEKQLAQTPDAPN